MKTKILTVIGAILTSSFLYAQDIQVTDKWQLLGATENISTLSFDGKCVDFVWKYNNGWQVHVANGSSYTLPSGITEFSTINKGEGFWVKGNGNCEVNATNIIDFKSLIVGKTLYFVAYDDFGHESQMGYNYARAIFDSNGSMSWEEFETIDSGQVYHSTYHFDNNGNLHTFDGETEGGEKYSFVSQTLDYITLKEIDDNSIVYMFFDKTKAKEFKDSKNNAQNLEFTKELLSTNPWYRIEYNNNEAYCNGKFAFDLNGNLTASWLENGNTQSVTLTYSITDGKIVTVQDGKKEIETLLSKDETTLTVNKVAKDAQTGEFKHSMGIKYFKNRQDAIDFGNSYGVNCNNDLP